MVRQTAIFDDFANAILSSHLPPLVSAMLSVNVIAGIVGSASGGLQVWMSSFAQDYLQAGVDPEVLHRVATIASGGLDSLPHCGAVITMFTGLQRRGCPERCTPKWNRYLETHKEVDKCNDTRYITEVIRTFKNRALKKLYEKGDPSKINADHIDRVEDILFRLDNAVKPSDMDWPGWKLHPLKGKHKGFWAIWVSGNYRIWGRFEDGDTFDVDYGDYH